MSNYSGAYAKPDANQAEIVVALRQVGASVLSVHRLKNCFDILVGYRGVNYIMEIKNPAYVTKKHGVIGALEPGELAFMESWKGGAYHIVQTADEALQIIGAIE
jgi:hypothetical protein